MGVLEEFFQLYMPHRICIANLWILVPYVISSIGTGIVYILFIPAALAEQLQRHGLDARPSDKKLARFVRWCGLSHIGTAAMVFVGAYGALTLVMIVMLYVSVDFYSYVRALVANEGGPDAAR